jgi:2-polyprenyl-3-methyl-5-hydroxy-6-metoxy-1,4-benzoquinol methylase
MFMSGAPRNPHFDDQRILWNDAYSGEYEPIAYDQQFDYQWKLFLDRERGFCDHTGVETSDEYVDDRIAELTGVRDFLWRREHGERADALAIETGRAERAERRGVGGRLYLEPKFPIDFFEGKRCLDLGCGAGRWTKALLALGARVKSTDVSEHGLQSTRRINDDVERLDLFDIGESRKDLVEAFDFTLCWGVLMCTHDPRAAFAKAAATVKPGGSMYIMVYMPSYHVGDFVVSARRTYHREKHSFEEKLAYCREISVGKEDNMINNLDMLNTFYNWVIDWDTIRGWFADNGFEEPLHLNATEPFACGYHVFATKKA